METYPIEAVSRFTGLSPFTLRNWERRYGFPRPEKPEGSRRYTQEQASLLRRAALLLKQGEKIRDLIECLELGRPLPAPKVEQLPKELLSTVDALYDSLIRFDSERADSHCALMSLRLSLPDLLDRVFHPLLRRLGEDWEGGRIDVAQEHYASAYVRLKLTPHLALGAPSGAKARTALCATIGTEQHAGGLMILASHLKLKGWKLHYFGAGLPFRALESAVKAIRPSVTCLSFTTTGEAQAALKNLAALPSRICIGGRGTASMPGDEPVPANVRIIAASGEEAADFVQLSTP